MRLEKKELSEVSWRKVALYLELTDLPASEATNWPNKQPTNELYPWRKILIKKQLVSQFSQENRDVLWNPTFQSHAQNSPTLVPVLSQINSVSHSHHIVYWQLKAVGGEQWGKFKVSWKLSGLGYNPLSELRG